MRMCASLAAARACSGSATQRLWHPSSGWRLVRSGCNQSLRYATPTGEAVRGGSLVKPGVRLRVRSNRCLRGGNSGKQTKKKTQSSCMIRRKPSRGRKLAPSRCAAESMVLRGVNRCCPPNSIVWLFSSLLPGVGQACCGGCLRLFPLVDDEFVECSNEDLTVHDSDVCPGGCIAHVKAVEFGVFGGISVEQNEIADFVQCKDT